MATPPSARRLPEVGDRIGPYRLLDLIGRGGMGAVYRARHEASGAEHAVKVILPAAFGAAVDDEERVRFRREAELLARLGGHPNVVRVFSLDAEGDLLYCAMELVAGETLQAALDRAGALAPGRAARLIAGAARGVAHAHEHGVVHRDIKPANIIIDATTGAPRLLDFGLALDASLTRLTESGAVLGTPSFMAPEQVEQADVGPAADVWALGATLWALLSGRPPFEGRDPYATMMRILSEDVGPPVGPAPIPGAIAAVCRKALARDPAARYASAAALADDLERALAGAPTDASVPGRAATLWWRVGPRTRAGRRALGIVGGLVGLVAAGAVAGVVLALLSALTESRLRAVEAGLDEGELAREAIDRLPAAAPAPLGDRIALVRAVADAVEARAVDPGRVARIAELARAVDETEAVTRLQAWLGKRGRHDLLAALLYGPAAEAFGDRAVVCAREQWPGVARALVDDERLAPPEDASFKGLLDALRHDQDGCAALLLRRSRARVARGDLAGAFEDALDAFDRTGAVGGEETWTDAMHATAVGAMLERGDDRRFGGVPAIAELVCHAPGDPALAVGQAAALQKLLDATIDRDLGASEAPLVGVSPLGAEAVLLRYGLDPCYRLGLATGWLFDEDPRGLATIEQRRGRRCNPARLLVLAREVERAGDLDAADRLRAQARQTVGRPERWAVFGAFPLAKPAVLDAALLRRMLARERARPDAERWPIVPVELVWARLAETKSDDAAAAREVAALAREAVRIQAAVAERGAAITEGGGTAPSAYVKCWVIVGAIEAAARVLMASGACCDDEVGVERLFADGMAMFADPRIDAYSGLSPQWTTAARLFEARAEHHRKHGRIAEAAAALEEGLVHVRGRGASFDTQERGQRAEIARLEKKLAALRGR